MEWSRPCKAFQVELTKDGRYAAVRGAKGTQKWSAFPQGNANVNSWDEYVSDEFVYVYDLLRKRQVSVIKPKVTTHISLISGPKQQLFFPGMTGYDIWDFRQPKPFDPDGRLIFSNSPPDTFWLRKSLHRDGRIEVAAFGGSYDAPINVVRIDRKLGVKNSQLLKDSEKQVWSEESEVLSFTADSLAERVVVAARWDFIKITVELDEYYKSMYGWDQYETHRSAPKQIISLLEWHVPSNRVRHIKSYPNILGILHRDTTAISNDGSLVAHGIGTQLYLWQEQPSRR